MVDRARRPMPALALVAAFVAAGAPLTAPVAATSPPYPIVGVTPSGLPAGADAVLINLATANATGPGYVTADRCSVLQPAPQSHASGTFAPGTATSNLAVAPIDADGSICVYHNQPVDLIADLEGSFAPGTSGDLFVPDGGRRLLDTRDTSPAPLGAGTITPVPTGAPAGTDAVLVNLAMVDGAAPGYVTADRCSTLQPGPQAHASGNHLTGGAMANLAVVPVDPDGRFCVFSNVAVHLVIDLQGTFQPAPPDGLGFAGGGGRVLDTRDASNDPLAAGSITTVHTGAPAGTSAVLVDLVMTRGTAPGYVTAGPCATLVAGAQTHANGNHAADATAANLSVVPVAADGTFCLYNQSPVHLVVDVEGRFAAGAADRFVLAAPSRILDTRPPAPPPPSGLTSCTSVIHIGDSTSVGLMSSSILKDPKDRISAQYARVGVTDFRPEISGARSTLETLPGQENAFQVAQRQRASGFHGCWVLALGTTDSANIAAGASPGADWRIDRMMSVIGNDPVLWVNVKTTETSGPWANSSMLAWDAALVRATARYHNIVIYDWASVAQTAWFSSDRVHYTPDGYRIRAKSIADALAAAYPS